MNTSFYRTTQRTTTLVASRLIGISDVFGHSTLKVTESNSLETIMNIFDFYILLII